MNKKQELFQYMKGFGSRIAAEYSVQRDEVAVILLSRDRTLLKFAHPVELSEGNMNAFPVAGHSIAGQVARTGKGSIINNASRVKHLSFYEQIRIRGRESSQIQKMVTAPIKTAAGKVLGVVQVSRKGPESGDLGPDFMMNDLRKLEEMASAASADITERLPEHF